MLRWLLSAGEMCVCKECIKPRIELDRTLSNIAEFCFTQCVVVIAKPAWFDAVAMGQGQ